jgi:hypothetical protein
MRQMILNENNMLHKIMNIEASHCCEAIVWGETKICSACKEHCEVVHLNDENDE